MFQAINLIKSIKLTYVANYGFPYILPTLLHCPTQFYNTSNLKNWLPMNNPCLIQ